jgi:hypothetical protein
MACAMQCVLKSKNFLHTYSGGIHQFDDIQPQHAAARRNSQQAAA